MDINDVSKNQKTYVKYSKLIDTQIELLKVYLNENSSISNIEARNRLEEETGLEANITAVGDQMKKLKKLANLYNNSTDPVTSHAIKKNKVHRYDYKIKDKHIEHLKIYLQRNIYINSEEAKNRLYRETGLEIGNQTLQRALEKLKKEIESEHDNFDISTSGSLVNNQHSINRSKLKDTHLALLKQYLKENNSISPEEASDKLRDETDLLVSAQIVQKAIKRLKEEASLMHSNLDPPISTIKTSSKSICNNSKVKEMHIDLLKKYLRENKYIGPTEAKNLLYKETSLEISITSASTQLKMLREEMGLECANLGILIANNRKNGSFTKLKDVHIDLLKKYLKEDKYIGPTEVKNRLYKDTGLILYKSTMQRYLKRLKEQMGPEYVNQDAYIIKNRKFDHLIKIKDSHLAYLKNYLKKDRFLRCEEAINRLQIDTGLKVTKNTIRKSLKRLREEIFSDSDTIHPSLLDSEDSKVSLSTNAKIEDKHKNCLKKYLKENVHIGPTEARNLLHKETGLEVSIGCASIQLKRLREEIGVKYANLDVSVIGNRKHNHFIKIKNIHLKRLKSYLKEDNHIKHTEAMRQLYDETGLQVHIKTVAKAMNMLRKEMNLDTPLLKSRLSDHESNLKDTILVFLEKYLNKNRFIGPVDAMKKLREETGIHVDILTIHQCLKTLKN